MLRPLALLTALSACTGAPSALTESPLAGAELLTWSAPTGRVQAVRTGDPTGRRVVLVHGTPGSWDDYERYLADPPAGLELIAYDRPGFGSSEPGGAVPSLAVQVSALAPLLVERNGSWPVLVGHSLGGPIVVRAAAEHPDRVGAVVVLAGNLDPDLEELRWYNHVGALLSPLLSRPLRNANNELGPQRRELEELEPLLAQVRCPVWILHGTEDRLVPLANATFLEGALVNAEEISLHELPETDHFFLWTRPGVVRQAIIEATQ